MKKLLFLLLVLFIFSSFSVKSNVAPAPATGVAVVKDPADKVGIPLEKIATMKAKELEKLIGRKMTLKEKIAIKIAQHKIKKNLNKRENGKASKGQTAFIISLIGLCILIIPYLNIASLPLAIIGLSMGTKAKRANPNDSKAQTAIILSIVTLGLLALAIIAVIVWISAWGWYWY